MQKLFFVFTLLAAVTFTFGYSRAPSGPARWSAILLTFVASSIAAAVVFALELRLVRALLKRKIDDRRRRGGDLTFRVAWNAVLISLLPAFLIFLASSIAFDRWFQLPPVIARNSRELIDEMNRADLLRLQILASETIVFSPDESGEFLVRSLKAGADCAWVLDLNGKIEKGGSIEPSESSFTYRPDAFVFGEPEGTFVRSLPDNLELWSVNDRTCLAYRKPIWDVGQHLGDLVVGHYTATEFVERYTSIEAQADANYQFSVFKRLPFAIVVLFFASPFLTLLVVYTQLTLVSDASNSVTAASRPEEAEGE